MTHSPTYTERQAARILGCTVATVQEWARERKLPGIKAGRGWVFPCEAFIEHINKEAREHLVRVDEPVARGVVVHKSNRRTNERLKAVTLSLSLPKKEGRTS